MIHCSYSPDLSPNDFFLFSNIKNKMRGERFESPEAVETFRTLISEVRALEWKNALKIDSSVCKNVSILKANTSKNNKAIYRIVYVFILFAETFPAAYVESIL